MRTLPLRKQLIPMTDTRTLKVYYGYQGNKRIPVIRLGGNYLTKMGFKAGDTIAITIEHNTIAIAKRLPSEADSGSAGEQPDRNSR